MSDVLLEHKTKSRRSVVMEQQRSERPSDQDRLKPLATPPKRPTLESRGFTETARGLESPSLISADQADPLDRVSTRTTAQHRTRPTNRSSNFSYGLIVARPFFSSLCNSTTPPSVENASARSFWGLRGVDFSEHFVTTYLSYYRVSRRWRLGLFCVCA